LGVASIADDTVASIVELDLAVGGELRPRHGVSDRYLILRHRVGDGDAKRD
jgi:hypothetical protein